MELFNKLDGKEIPKLKERLMNVLMKCIEV